MLGKTRGAAFPVAGAAASHVLTRSAVTPGRFVGGGHLPGLHGCCRVVGCAGQVFGTALVQDGWPRRRPTTPPRVCRHHRCGHNASRGHRFGIACAFGCEHYELPLFDVLTRVLWCCGARVLRQACLAITMGLAAAPTDGSVQCVVSYNANNTAVTPFSFAVPVPAHESLRWV